MWDELILVWMLKYFLTWKWNWQSVSVKRWDFWQIWKIENYYKFQNNFTQYNKIIVPTSDKKFLTNFLSQFFDSQILDKIELVWELPHWIRSFLKRIFKWKFLDFLKYFKADDLVVWWGEIFTEECWSWPLFFWITALPFWLKKFFTFWKWKVYLFGWIQKPYRWFNKILIRFWINIADWFFLRDFDSIETVCSLKRSYLPIEKKKYYWQFINSVYFMFDHSLLLFCDDRWMIVRWYKQMIVRG